MTILEQFELGHARGSSHGSSRIFRLSYPDPHYVRLAQQALAGWRELEDEVGEELIIRTGALDIGRSAHDNAPALAACDVAHKFLSGTQVAARWPIATDPDAVALFHPEGGVTRADRAHAAFLGSARAAGAEVLEHTRVDALRREAGGVALDTPNGAVHARAVVVTAGAWARALLGPLGVQLDVSPTRETIAYFPLSGADELPPVIELGEGPGEGAFGLAAPGTGLKAGNHRSGRDADPDAPGEPDQAIVHAAAEWVAQRYPGAGSEPLGAETCLYTNTEDESFVCGRHDRIVVGSVCSGHGFKFAPVTGLQLAALAAEALD